MAHMIVVQSLVQEKNLITIELNTGESISIPDAIAAQYKLIIGKTLSKEEYRQIKIESERYLCKQKALDYLSIKNRTSYEIRKYLLKKAFSADIINEIIMDLENSGIIDDAKYAIEYTRSRRTRKLVGKRLIRKELKQKGISNVAIKKAFEEEGYSEAQIEEVLALARRKFISLKEKKNALRKVAFFLAQRGFDYDLIYQVIEQLEKESQNTKGVDDA